MDVWTIIGYIIAVLFNVGIVAAIRAKAYDGGKKFLTSGRFAIIAVFVLCFLEQLVVGGFEALQNAQALTELLRNSWIMAGAAMGTQTALKTGAEALEPK